MKQLFTIILLAMLFSCHKEEIKPKTLTPHGFVWEGKLYCAYFYKLTSPKYDTICHKVVTKLEMDSMSDSWGDHIYCTYPHNDGIEVGGRQINDPSECN